MRTSCCCFHFESCCPYGECGVTSHPAGDDGRHRHPRAWNRGKKVGLCHARERKRGEGEPQSPVTQLTDVSCVDKPYPLLGLGCRNAGLPCVDYAAGVSP